MKMMKKAAKVQLVRAAASDDKLFEMLKELPSGSKEKARRHLLFSSNLR